MTEPTLSMWDASNLPDPQPTTPVAAFYIGGDTPHVYTDEQVKAIRARWGLPIWTCYDQAHDGPAEAAKAMAWLHAHGWKPGTLIALDTEELIIPNFISEFDGVVRSAGWYVMRYGSEVAISGNPQTSGGRWTADWTGIPHLNPGDTATQYAPDKWLGAPYDLSVILASAPLHELNPPVVHHITYIDVTMRLPILGVGDQGPAVKRMQHLLEAWYPGSTGPAGADGFFGAVTLAGLVSFQRAHGISPPTGACDSPTWAHLVEG